MVHDLFSCSEKIENDIIPCHLDDGATPEAIQNVTQDLKIEDIAILINFDIARMGLGGGIPTPIKATAHGINDHGQQKCQEDNEANHEIWRVENLLKHMVHDLFSP